jgi:hypothetical protein
LRRGRLTRADLELLGRIKAGYPPQSEDRAWNRLALHGLAYLDVTTSGEGEIELCVWKLTPAGEACADLEA